MILLDRDIDFTKQPAPFCEKQKQKVAIYFLFSFGSYYCFNHNN